jgi:hypothetical protein
MDHSGSGGNVHVGGSQQQQAWVAQLGCAALHAADHNTNLQVGGAVLHPALKVIA